MTTTLIFELIVVELTPDSPYSWQWLKILQISIGITIIIIIRVIMILKETTTIY